jgi:hypothetical protein
MAWGEKGACQLPLRRQVGLALLYNIVCGVNSVCKRVSVEGRAAFGMGKEGTCELPSKGWSAWFLCTTQRGSKVQHSFSCTTQLLIYNTAWLSCTTRRGSHVQNTASHVQHSFSCTAQRGVSSSVCKCESVGVCTAPGKGCSAWTSCTTQRGVFSGSKYVKRARVYCI